MTSILGKIEDLFKPEARAVEAFGKTVAGDVVAWVKREDAVVVAAAQAAWTKAAPIITAIVPSQYAILEGLVAKGAADAAEGDYTAIAADVLKQAAAQELTWITNLGQGLLNALVALLAYKPPAKA